MSLKEKIYNELKSCPSLQAMIDTLQDATTPGGSLTPGWLTKKFGRGEPMTFEQADNGKTNPKFQEDVENGYNTNCVTAVLAFEARLRGYNVEARPKSQRDLGVVGTPCWLSTKWFHFLSKSTEGVFSNPYFTTPNKTITALEIIIAKGERYLLRVGWKKSDYGHVLLAYKDNIGKLVIYCPQSNAFYDNKKKMMKLFGDVATTSVFGGQKRLNVVYARVDNMPFDREMMGKLFTKTGETK